MGHGVGDEGDGRWREEGKEFEGVQGRGYVDIWSNEVLPWGPMRVK